MSIRRVLVPTLLVAFLGGALLWWGAEPTPAEAVCPSTISYGQTVACDISVVGEHDVFTFSGTAGHEVIVRATVTATSITMWPDIEVRDPAGTVRAACSGWTYNQQVAVTCSLDTTGTWSVEISDNQESSAQAYELHIQRLDNPSGATPTTYGAIHAATMTPGGLDAYTFDGTDGHEIHVRAATVSDSAWPDWDLRVVRPDGTIKCAGTYWQPKSISFNCILDATGSWTVLAGNFKPTPGEPGDYTLRVVRAGTAPPDDPTKRILDTSYPGIPTGDFSLETTDLSFPGRGLPLEFTRYYHSGNSRVGGLGRGWTHTYDMYVDDQTTRVLVYYPQGFTREFVWNGSSYDAAPGVWDKFVKNGDGTYRLTTQQQVVYDFDSSGRLETVADRNGNTTSLYYNSNGHLSRAEDPTGRRLQLGVWADGRISFVVDDFGRTVTFGHDSNGRLTSATSALGGTTTYTYISAGMVTLTDALGQVQATNGYDASSRLSEHRDALNGVTCYYYYYSSVNTPYWSPSCQGATVKPVVSEVVVVDPEGHETRIEGDSEYRYASETNAEIGYWFREYDDDNNLLTLTDPHGEITTFTYDARGNLLTNTNPLGQTWTYTYNSFDEVLTAKDPLNNTATYAYDVKGNLISVTDAASNATSFVVDANGQVTRVTDAETNATNYTYDTYGNQTTVTDALSNTWTSVYDLGGRVTSVTDPMSHVTSYTYNDANQVLTQTNPLSQVTAFIYDLKGRNTSVTDAELNTTTFGYDNADRLNSVTDALSQATTYAYDGVGNQTSVTNTRGKVTSYTYDGLGRRLSVTDPLSRTTTYVYNRAGELTSRTDARSLVSEYVYDSAGRVTAIDYKTGGGIVDEIDYGYDAAGHRTSMTDSTGTTVWAYNTIGQVTRVTHPGSKIFDYTYDAVGNTTQIEYPDLKTVDYTYDVLNRLDGVQDWALNSTSYAWGDTGTLTSTTLPNGVIASYAYDNADRLLSVTNKLGAATLSSSTYTLDTVGNRTQMVDGTGTATYALDDLYRLTSVTYPGPDTDTYSYDPLGNRLTKNADPYTYDDADQLLTAVGGGAAPEPEGGLELHDAAVNWDEKSAGGTTFSVSSGATMLVVVVGTEEIGAGPKALDGLSSGIDGAFDGIAVQATKGTTNENTVAIGYLLNPSVGDHNISLDWGGASPDDVTVTAFSLTGEVDGSPIGTTGTDLSMSSGVLSIGSLDVTGYDFGVFAAASGGDNANNLWAPDSEWTEFTDTGDNSSSHFVQARNYAELGSDSVDTTYSGGTNRQAGIVVIFRGARPEGGLELHDAAIKWDEKSAGGTTFGVTSGATMLVVVVGTEEIGAGPKALDGLSSSIDGAFDGIAIQATIGGTNENTVAIGYLLNPSVGAHNISFDWGGTGPDDVTATAFSLTGTVDSSPVGTTGTDLVMSSGVLSIGSLDVTGYDFGVFAGVSGGANGNNLWAPDSTWTEFTDSGDNSSSHFVQARGYAGSGTDTVDATYSGGTNRQAGIAVVFKGAQPSGSGPVSYGYDNNGNMVSRGSDTFSWDHRNRMTTSVVGGVSASYTYNGDGVRMSQTVGGVPTTYNVDVLAPLPIVMQDGTYSYVYGLDLISAVDGAGSEIYYLYDGLGSVANLTDDTGAVTDSYTYDVFGEIRTSSGSTSNDWQFTGEQEDESGLYFLRARYYDPTTGRFIGRDPLEFAQRYAYAGNNPVAFTDPSGLCPICAAVAAIPVWAIYAGGAATYAVIVCQDVGCGADSLDASGRNFAANATAAWRWSTAWARDGDDESDVLQPERPENPGNLDRIPDWRVPEGLAGRIKKDAAATGRSSEWEIVSDGEWLWIRRKDRTGENLPTGWTEDELPRDKKEASKWK